jgi:hypothetical protein
VPHELPRVARCERRAHERGCLEAGDGGPGPVEHEDAEDGPCVEDALSVERALRYDAIDGGVGEIRRREEVIESDDEGGPKNVESCSGNVAAEVILGRLAAGC